MEFSMKKAALATVALAFAGAIAFAQGSTASKPPATQAKPGTAQKPATTAKPAASPYDKALLTPKALVAQAPAEFDVKFVTTQGDFNVHVTRDWAPHGADRFYNLVKHHYFDGVALFRVVPGFMAQFGISAYPAVAKAWDDAKIPDDAVKHGNTRGAITFAAESAPNTRTTQVFINYKNNAFLDSQRFAAFGEVTEGMDVVDKFYGGYGDAGAPDQGKMTEQGKAYTDAGFPKLDHVKTATVVAPAAAPKTGAAAAKPATSH